jgi:hypothetical protein
MTYKYEKKALEEPQDILSAITCDICGYVWEPARRHEKGYPMNGEFMTLRANWGWDSAQDGDIWIADICEKCVKEKLDPIVPFLKYEGADPFGDGGDRKTIFNEMKRRQELGVKNPESMKEIYSMYQKGLEEKEHNRENRQEGKKPLQRQKRFVPAKVKEQTDKKAVLKKATQTTRSKVKINFVKSVRG